MKINYNEDSLEWNYFKTCVALARLIKNSNGDEWTHWIVQAERALKKVPICLDTTNVVDFGTVKWAC